MKRVLFKFLLFVGLVAGLSACERYVAPDNTVRRTVLVYMEARNSLSGNSQDDIVEMRLADIPKDCRVLVYHSAYGSAPKLIEVVNGREVVLKQYPEGTSAVDSEQMRSVIVTAQTIAPALEYGLILWSHSSGWMQSPVKARGFGLENSREQMSVSDLADALEGCELDFIVFDTCYMGCVEVAYELRRSARYMVASVCEVPEDGMPYDLTLRELLDKNMVGGLKRAIDITVESYVGEGGCPSTLSLTDLTKMDSLAEAVVAASGELPETFEPQVFSISTPYKRLFYDFGQWFQAIGGDKLAMDDAILYERHTASVWGQVALTHCSGLSIYLPEFSQGYDYDSYGHSTLEWYNFIHSQY